MFAAVIFDWDGTLADTHSVVVVEDSLFGARASKVAGMMCIAIPSGAYTIEELGKGSPDLIVHSLVVKKKILGFMLG